jgi:ribosome-associated toxin RatA of RatAB toxin-antitoxin module
MKSPELAKSIQLVNDGVYSEYKNLIAFKTIEKEICATILKMQHNVKSSIQKKLIGLVKERMISSAIECA